MTNAYEDLINFLEVGEEVEGIVFGEYGWGNYGEEVKHIPEEKQGKVMSLEEAEPMMQGWSFYGGYGAPECYAVYIWTTKRIIWVTQYDGSTNLTHAPRNPVDIVPGMPGG